MTEDDIITRIPTIMHKPDGIKEVCRILFKNDAGQPLELTDYQTRIVEANYFKSPKKVVCTAPTRAGKSLALGVSVVLLTVFSAGGERVRLISDTKDHTRIIMNYVIQHVLDNDYCKSMLMFDVKGMGADRLRKELTKQKITFKNGSEVMTLTADILGEGKSLIGWGGTSIIVDEAEQIPTEIIRTKIMRMLGDNPDSNIFMIGNPTKHGYMYEVAKKPDWKFIRINWQDCVEAGRMTYEFVMDRKNEMLPNEFKIWYEAEWAEELQDQLFSGEELALMFSPVLDDYGKVKGELYMDKLTEIERTNLFEKQPDEKRLGVDVARFGNDFTVLYKAVRYEENWYFTECKYFQKKDTMSTVGQIIAWDKIEEFDIINIDDSGLGGGVTDRLKEVEKIGDDHEQLVADIKKIKSKVYAFIAGESPWKLNRKLTKKEEEDNKSFLNKKAYWFRNFEALAKKGNVKCCDMINGQKLLEELKKMRYEFTSYGKLRILDPEEKSPDFADAANIALYSPSKFVFRFF